MARLLNVLSGRRFFRRWLILFACTCTSTCLLVFLFYHYYDNLQSSHTTNFNIEDSNASKISKSDKNLNKSLGQLETFFRTKLSPPGLILQTKGGIGNQLFQYACSYALAQDLGWPLYLYFDNLLTSYRLFQPGLREFALDHFEIPINLIDRTTRFSSNITNLDDQTLFPRKFLNQSNSQNQFYENKAYCQSKEYWKNYENEIQTMFQPRTSAINFLRIEKTLKKIRSSEESVAVHVRLGDFVGRTAYFVPISYQRYAMRKMMSILKGRGKAKPVFFIFSDDVAHVEKLLKDLTPSFELVFVSREIQNSTSIEDFYLMTLCKHIIIPNSTYSWWAAYLIKYKKKIVIASAHNPNFFKDFPGKDDLFDDFYGRFYHPIEWVLINPFTGGLSIDHSNYNNLTK